MRESWVWTRPDKGGPGHFRVIFCFCFKTSPRVRMCLIWMKMNLLDGEHIFTWTESQDAFWQRQQETQKCPEFYILSQNAPWAVPSTLVSNPLTEIIKYCGYKYDKLTCRLFNLNIYFSGIFFLCIYNTLFCFIMRPMRSFKLDYNSINTSRTADMIKHLLTESKEYADWIKSCLYSIYISSHDRTLKILPFRPPSRSIRTRYTFQCWKTSNLCQ